MQRQPALDVRVAGKRVVIATVFFDVEGFDEFFVIAELEQVVLQIFLLGAPGLDHCALVQVELDELGHREVGQAFHPYATAPQGIEGAPSQAHQHFHAGTANGNEQRRP